MGELDNFTYLLENTSFSNENNFAWWLENVRSDNSRQAWSVNGYYRTVYGNTVEDISSTGVRPAIEVSKTNIEY